MGKDKKTLSKHIWQECFNDEDKFVSFYFDNIYKDENTYLIDKDKKAVSHVQTLPYLLHINGYNIPINYISGACTSKEYREKGLMQRLLFNTLSDREQKGDLLSILIPANETLYQYYENKFGYKTFFYDCLTSEIGDVENVLPKEVTTSSLVDLIHSVETARSFACVLHSEQNIKNIIKEYTLSDNAHIVYLQRKANSEGEVIGVAFVIEQSNNIIVKDIFCAKNDVAKLQRKLTRRFQGKQIIYTIGLSQHNTQLKKNPRGMAKLLTKDSDKSLITEKDLIQSTAFISLMHE